MEVTGKQIENLGSLTQSELTEILEKYGTISDTGAESILDENITSKDEKYVVKVREIWEGNFAEGSTETTVKFSLNFSAVGSWDTEVKKDYEVPNGTTWMEFLKNSEFVGAYGIMYKEDTRELIRYQGENATGASAICGYICDKTDKRVLVDDIIKNGIYVNSGQIEVYSGIVIF